MPLPIRPVQFALVREDPAIELALADELGASNVLLVASGGCTALTFAVARPQVAVTAFDLNSAQLDLISAKLEALAASESRDGGATWGIGADEPSSLSGCGNFESLFRSLRNFLAEFVACPDEIRKLCVDGTGQAISDVVSSRYWPAAFDACFADGVLRAMFGDAAVQHPPAGGYARHFQRVIEVGLRRPDAARNRFLHAVLLGAFIDRDECLPPYLRASTDSARRPELHHGPLMSVPALASFDLISLSNIPDWMSAGERRALAADLEERARPGATLLVRSIASAGGLRAELAPSWKVDVERSSALPRTSQALFYSDFLIATKR